MNLQLPLRRKGIVFTMLFVFALLFTTFSPTPASASGFTFSIDRDQLRTEETAIVSAHQMCPNQSSPYSMFWLKATLTDADNQTFTNLDVGAAQADGVWFTGKVTIPEIAALGTATLQLECWDAPSGGTLTQTYDPITITVVPQPTELTVDNPRWKETGHFESVTPCPTPGDVWVEIVSQSAGMTSLGSTDYGIYDLYAVQTDSSGNWVYDFEFSTQAGFTGAGEIFVLRATCMDGTVYEYDSLKFKLMGERYVALGDSFSSGEGAFSYGTVLGVPWQNPQNAESVQCHRSRDSYPYYVATLMLWNDPKSVACTGATTDDLWDTQLNAVNSDARVVTLTIGGNDAAFGPVVSDCAQSVINPNGWDCASNTTMTDQVDLALEGLAGTQSVTLNGREIHSIKSVIQQIHSRAEDAAIFIGLYPNLFGRDTSYFDLNPAAPGGYSCGDATVSFSYEATEWFNEKTEELNDIIVDAVEELDDTIDVTWVPDSFGDHVHCALNGASDPYLNWVVLDGTTPMQESLHPNVTGIEEGYGVMFHNAISNH